MKRDQSKPEGKQTTSDGGGLAKPKLGFLGSHLVDIISSHQISLLTGRSGVGKSLLVSFIHNSEVIFDGKKLDWDARPELSVDEYFYKISISNAEVVVIDEAQIVRSILVDLVEEALRVGKKVLIVTQGRSVCDELIKHSIAYNKTLLSVDMKSLNKVEIELLAG